MWNFVCLSAFSQSCPGPSAISPGTPIAALRTPTARTKPSGWLPTPPTSHLPSQSSGSELHESTHACTLV